METATIEKPPLGLHPRKFREEERVREIDAAIARYVKASFPVPQDWTDERDEILRRLFPLKSWSNKSDRNILIKSWDVKMSQWQNYLPTFASTRMWWWKRLAPHKLLYFYLRSKEHGLSDPIYIQLTWDSAKDKNKKELLEIIDAYEWVL